MADIQQDLQSDTPGHRVELFILDATKAGGSIYYFCQGAIEGAPVEFNSVVYTPVDCKFEGWEITATGALPTPRMTLSNVDAEGNPVGYWQTILNSFGDLAGCELRRIRTFRQHLDDGSDPDPTAYLGPDIFIVDRKVREDNAEITWELSAGIDQEGKMLPARVVIRDTCMWRYRRWDTGTSSFDYSKAQCPYVGANGSFDINDQPTTDENDVPSRRLSCCKVRFGDGNSLPFGGFPGAARVAG